MTQYQDQELNCRHGDLIEKSSEWYSWDGTFKRKLHFVYRFRANPVPGIRRRRWHKGCYYKAPSNHLAMRRMVFKAIDDGIPLRQKWAEIPDPWKDIKRHVDRCWKSFRETQYK